MTNHFQQIFNGEQSRFTAHIPPFTKTSAKNAASWVGWAKFGSKSFPEAEDHQAGTYVPVAKEHYEQHLKGTLGLALSPLKESVTLSKNTLKNVCAYGIIDIDMYNVDYLHIIRRLYSVGFKFAPIKSKSGGMHLYFVFSRYEKAVQVRQTLKTIAMLFGLHHIYNNGVSKVEIFPEHDEVRTGVKDKGVLLPYCGKLGNVMITADGDKLDLKKAIEAIGKQFTSIEEITQIISSLPYSDAPYCVQSILLSGALWEGSHRNDFLFTAALYLKLKHGKTGMDIGMLKTMNDMLADPVDDEDIKSIFASVEAGDYPILGQCKKEPVVSFCDKKICASREYTAVKKEKNNVSSNVELGKIYRMKAEVPYYLVQARVAGDGGEFKLLRVDNAENFLQQRTIQKECIDKLGIIPWTVKQQLWEERINERLQTLEEKEVTRETDTTELSELYDLFIRYLTHRQATSNTPLRVNLKQVYSENGTYYFKTDGFKEYLRIARYTIGRTNLREQLLQYGCKEGNLTYTRRDGSMASIRCWVKQEDEHLKNMKIYFDDVLDDDAQLIEQTAITEVKF